MYYPQASRGFTVDNCLLASNLGGQMLGNLRVDSIARLTIFKRKAETRIDRPKSTDVFSVTD